MKIEGNNFIFNIGGRNPKPPRKSQSSKRVDSVVRRMPKIIVREAQLAWDDPVLRVRAAIGLGGSAAIIVLALIISSFFFVASINPVIAYENGELVQSTNDFYPQKKPVFLIKTNLKEVMPME